MDQQPKKRSLPAFLAASTVREQDLPATLQAVANTRHTAAEIEKRARRLPASLVAEAEQEQPSLPELTLSNVRIVCPPYKAAWHMALSRFRVLVMSPLHGIAVRPITNAVSAADADSVDMLFAAMQCRVIYTWLPFELDNWCGRLLAAPPCVVGLDIEWHVTYVAGARSQWRIALPSALLKSSDRPPGLAVCKLMSLTL